MEVTDATFNDFIKKYPLVVVDCWAPWCGPCRMMSPVIDGLAKDMEGKVAFGKLNTDQNPKTSMRFQIEAIPTLLVFKDGEMAERLVGSRPKDDLADGCRLTSEQTLIEFPHFGSLHGKGIITNARPIGIGE